jgi:hypothetical protein
MPRKALYSAILVAFAAGSAVADAGDPPSRVARLSFQSGSVSFRPGSVEEWTAATLNYPLTTGDHLWTDSGARTEMHIGSTAVRMASQTALSFINLDDRTVQLSLTQGALDVRIRYLGEGEIFEVDTPNAAISLLRPGAYRIDADGDRNVTSVTVRGGEAEVNAGGSAFPVRAQESARVSGMDTVTQEVVAAPPPNDFDRWCESREDRAERSQSVRYVGREMTGYEDLDEYGAWRQEPMYGWVWVPRAMAPGWAPYRFGHWAWVEPWGWTWIDDAPWGFAPFHYGRWAYAGGGWIWVPGAVVARPVYAPALVAFVGGPRFGVSVAVGGGGFAGWFPLGPREVYRPVYHVSETYVRQVNITHVTNINVVNVTNVTNVRYVNQGVAGAVTVVRHDDFVRARPAYRSAVSVPEREIVQAPVAGSAPPLAPRRESVLAGGGRRGGAPPARYADRAVIARTAPPPPPVSFGAKQQALEANHGRPLDPATVDGLRQRSPQRTPMVRTVAPVQGGGTPAPGWRRGNAIDQANPRPQQQDVQPAGPPRIDMPRGDRPARVREDQPSKPPAPAAVPARAPERQLEQPRDNRPARVEQPAAAPAPARAPERQLEQPRDNRPARVEKPAPAPAPARAPERHVEQPRNDRPPREANPAGGRGGRGEARQERKAEERRDERK